MSQICLADRLGRLAHEFHFGHYGVGNAIVRTGSKPVAGRPHLAAFLPLIFAFVTLINHNGVIIRDRALRRVENEPTNHSNIRLLKVRRGISGHQKPFSGMPPDRFLL